MLAAHRRQQQPSGSGVCAGDLQDHPRLRRLAVCATQDLNDFFALEDGKYGKGIINNSKTKVILNLEDEEAQRVGSILHLSEAELMEITHFERGSALISTNNNNVAVEIKCSELEKELITTDRRELQELLKRSGKTECV